MNIPILISKHFDTFGFFHSYIMGDEELKLIKPNFDSDDNYQETEKWTMARGTNSTTETTYSLVALTIGLLFLIG